MSENLRNKPESYWREKLSPEQYRVLREGGTEAPGTGTYAETYDDGVYRCAACGQELFMSDAKFESTLPGLQGWPAFWTEAAKGRVELRPDDRMGMHRTEIICANCGSHLGHLFEDDPTVKDKGGKHYCVNSCALEFTKKR